VAGLRITRYLFLQNLPIPAGTGEPMLSRTRECLANEVATWRHLGLIDDALAEILSQRYDARGSAGHLLLRWLGLFGIFALGSAILGLVGLFASAAGPWVPAGLAAVVSGMLWHAGARMAIDPRQFHPMLGSALITVGLVGGFGTLALLATALGATDFERFAFALLFATAAAALATAYRFALRWPLLLGLLCFFHAVGSWHGYAGHGAYVADIQDERMMALVALVSIGVGVWHETQLEAGSLSRYVGFGSFYLVFGLLYLNLSLWFLSLRGVQLAWVLVFTAAGIAQIVAGAALKDRRFTGFGVVFLSIDLYTRFFEHFWDRLSAGSFFTFAGFLGMGLGALFEYLARRQGVPS
jgi:hypothetical protein